MSQNADLDQRKREIAALAENPGSIADAIERIIDQTPVVKICEIDEYECVWYEATLTNADGRKEWHKLIIYNDDTWEKVTE